MSCPTANDKEKNIRRLVKGFLIDFRLLLVDFFYSKVQFQNSEKKLLFFIAIDK